MNYPFFLINSPSWKTNNTIFNTTKGKCSVDTSGDCTEELNVVVKESLLNTHQQRRKKKGCVKLAAVNLR